MAARGKNKPGTQVVSWDEQLAKQAEVAKAMEANTSTGGKPFFSVKGGVLAFDGSPVPGNQMVVIVLDSIFENIYYEGYNPDVFEPPVCYAHARIESDLVPHSEVVEREQNQHEACEGCPLNEWGSADVGKGKACKNRRRLALIQAGTIDAKSDEWTLIEDPEHYAKTPEAFLNLPVTSVANWATFVKTTADILKRPPLGVVALCRLVPNAKTQFEVTWEVLQKVPDELMETLMARFESIQTEIMFPNNLDEREEEEAPPPRSRSRAAKSKAKPAARKPAARKPAARKPAARKPAARKPTKY